MAERTFVIVGAGMAGAKAAETLREEGFDGRLVLVGEEREAPYERPPLSKGYLTGDSAREEVQVHATGFYAEHGIELIEGTAVTALDPAAHTIELAGGAKLDYHRVLLATGAIPRRPPIPGADLDGVHVLRSLADADALRDDLARGGALAVIGAGWIGCEVAASARGRGAEVTLLEHAEQPLSGVLGKELGGFFARVHRHEGVRVVTGARVELIEGRGRVNGVRLADGTRIPCDTVVLGVGVTAETRLADAAGLEVDNGIVADEHLRTSQPDVFAAGDVANAWRPRYGRRLRVEHWANALQQGPAAARSMLDNEQPFDALPYFFSDQYGIGMEYFGLHSPDDRLVLRGDPDGRRFHAFWIGRDGRLSAAMHVNEWDSTEPIKQLVDTAARVDPEWLADTSQPVRDLAGAAHVD